MKQFLIAIVALLSISMSANAQKYLDHLQQHVQGQGTVTVNQSKDIEELVNGKPITETKVQTHPKSEEEDILRKKATPDAKKKTIAENTKKTEHHETETREKTEPRDKVENESVAVDMSKKVMRSSYKVTGYRVQAFAGGNSRADRQKAEQIGNAIKMRYPDQPVYVHFYSPRWICRVGNFRSQSEANAMLAKIRAMGYRQACLVKGKITVQN